MPNIKLQNGDIFCTANPMWLGKAINFVQKINSKDNESTYSHSGIILDDSGTTFEALWTNKRQNIYEAYKGIRVLVGRNENMTELKFIKGWSGIAHHEGEWYAGHRLLLFPIPFLAKYLNLGLGVCSELTMKFLFKAGLSDFWKGINPDDVSDMIHKWKEYRVVYEGVL